jgi:hypothetical protein
MHADGRRSPVSLPARPGRKQWNRWIVRGPAERKEITRSRAEPAGP